MRFSPCKAIYIASLLFFQTGMVFAQGNGEPRQQAHNTPQFTENKGQWDENVLYRLRMSMGAVFFEKDKVTFSLIEPAHDGEHNHSSVDSLRKCHAFKVHFEGCNPDVTVSGIEQYGHHENYFLGNDPSKWASNVRVFKEIRYHNLYPGIDLVYKGNWRHLEYTFYVQPHADPSLIKLRFEGVDSLYEKYDTLDNQGKLHYSTLHYFTSVSSIHEENLLAWQLAGDSTFLTQGCRFIINRNENAVSFRFPLGYDPNYELVIDPTLIFSTYTGSFADNFGFTATYDNAGNLYAGGIVQDIGYPTTTGAFDENFNGDWDVSITKFDGTGATLVYSTYIGGLESENPSSIVVDHLDQLVIIGETSSPDFPTTTGAFDRSFNFGVGVIYPNNGQNFSSGTDIFITKLNASGSALVGSTYLGGSDNDGLNDDQTFNHPLYYNYGDQFRGEVAVDGAGNIYGVSSTMSTNFPVTAGVFQSISGGRQEAVVFKLNPTLTQLTWSSYLGGSGSDAGYNLLVDDMNTVYVSGGTNSTNFPATAGSLNPTYRGGNADGFVAHISANGNALLQATYIGTSEFDQSYFIDNDGSNNIYIIGLTDGNYPITSGVYSNANSGQFITALNSTLSSVILSTVFGRGDGDPDISPTAFLVDHCRNIYVSGWAGQTLINLINFNPPTTTVAGMPITPDAYEPNARDGQQFYFIVLSKDASSLAYATYFGSPGAADHVDGGTSRFDKSGIIYQAVCAGCGGFDDFPEWPIGGVWGPDNNSANCNEGLIKFQFELIGVDVSISASPATQGCVPLTVTFNGNALNAKDFYWDFGDGNISTAVSPTHTFSDTGHYTVMLIGVDSTTCDNLIFADTSFIPIRVRDDSVSAQFTPDILSNCDSFIVQFNSTSINATTYRWNFGDATTSTEESPRHEYTAPGTYDVSLIVTNNTSCNISDTLVTTITLQPIIDADITVPDSFGCIPFTVNFINSSNGGVQYTWDFDDGDSSTERHPSHIYPDTGTFTVSLIIIDSASCNIIDSATTVIRTSDNRMTSAFSMDTLAFECDSIVISFTNLSTNYTSLLWDFGDGNTTATPNPVYTFTSNDSFNIRLITSNPNACNETDTSAQLFLQPENVAAAIEGNSGCAPLDLELENNSVNATSYLWRFWDGTISTDEQVPPFTALPPGSYPVTLTAYNPQTCNDSSVATATFTVFGNPSAFFTLDDTLYWLHDPVEFHNQSSTGSYFWNFGDDETSTLADSVFHAYHDTGVYIPCLTVTTAEGCDSTYCAQLRIDFTGIIDLPNAFSPNADGFNDVLFLRGLGVSELEFKIYNRWGELVFETNDIAIVCNEIERCIQSKGWDGTYKDEKQEMDVYVYTLRATFENGEDTGLRKGNITLIR